nr:tail fiber protein [Massilia sp. BJB1822]
MTRTSRTHKPLILGLLTAMGLTWTSASHACATEPFIGSVCIMAFGSGSATNKKPPPLSFARGMYLLADGRMLQIAENNILFAIIGSTYGGDGRNNFALPNLAGRFVMGASKNVTPIDYVGAVGGTASTTLTLNHLPQHTHALADGISPTLLSGEVDTTNTVFSTTIGSAIFTGKLYSAAAPAASDPDVSTNDPANAMLGVTPGTQKIYQKKAPTVEMRNGAVTGTVALSNIVTTMKGSLKLSNAILTGYTGPTGLSQAFTNLPPYITLPYYIAAQGLYPDLSGDM